MQTLTVLVVDDEPGIRSGVERILRNFTVDYPFMDESISFDVKLAATGEEAIEFINNNPTDIALLDNKLPGIHGIDVLNYIRDHNYDILVMMITSHASLDIAVKATNIGAYDFVPKPFTPQELKLSIENITKHLFLKRMTKQMQKEGKTIRFQFLSVMSHELKAPLHAVEGYLNMIKERQFGNKIEDYEKIIDRSLERIHGMRAMIMDMLDLTKLESGKKVTDPKLIDLVPVIHQAVDTMRPYAIQKDVKVSINSPEKVMFTADQDDIEIIFNNLISNAIKYNITGGKVTCNFTITENAIKIDFIDTGIGMTEEEQMMLFKEFVRIKNQKTKNITGSGLGLSIVKRLTDLYSGTIEVSSQPDKGTIFSLILPKV